jgi:Xaa-Pro dipeptidase
MSSHVSLPGDGGEAAFPREEFEARVRNARRMLADRGIGLLMITGPENIFYLTGQQTPGYYTFQALLLYAEGDLDFVVRQLELPNCRKNTFLESFEVYQDGEAPTDVLASVFRRRPPRGRVAIERNGWFLPAALYERMVELLGPVEEGSGIVESLRMIKSPAELDAIESAGRYVEAGMRAGLASVAEGKSENDLAAAMMSASVSAGSEYFGMEPLVSSGPRSGTAHATWRRRRLMNGDGISLAMAACHHRYHAALMRSCWIGKPPAKAVDMMATSLEALEAALDAIRPGVACEAVHAACQAVIDRRGYSDNYRKRTGYSMGISFAPDWGEGNILSLFSGVPTLLRPGMVLHLPTALRDYGNFTVGASETVVVTETGFRPLSALPRELATV